MNLDQELAKYNSELKHNPNNEVAKKGKSLVLNNKAVAVASKNKLEEAIRLLNQAIELNPNNAVFYANKAEYFSKLGKYNDSIDCASKALEIDANSQSAKSLLILNLTNQYTGDMQKGKHEEALEKINRALEFKPNDKNILYNKAANLFNLSRLTEALECADKSSSMDDKFANPKSLKAIIYNQLSLEDSKNENNEEALRKVNLAIELKANEVGFHINKTSYLTALKRFEEAKEAVEKALRLDPKNKDALHLKTVIKENSAS
jgi:tetratricopeptide (TPR) repeat protein